jgi:hypothetical protein
MTNSFVGITLLFLLIGLKEAQCANERSLTIDQFRCMFPAIPSSRAEDLLPHLNNGPLFCHFTRVVSVLCDNSEFFKSTTALNDWEINNVNRIRLYTSFKTFFCLSSLATCNKWLSFCVVCFWLKFGVWLSFDLGNYITSKRLKLKVKIKRNGFFSLRSGKTQGLTMLEEPEENNPWCQYYEGGCLYRGRGAFMLRGRSYFNLYLHFMWTRFTIKDPHYQFLSCLKCRCLYRLASDHFGQDFEYNPRVHITQFSFISLYKLNSFTFLYLQSFLFVAVNVIFHVGISNCRLVVELTRTQQSRWHLKSCRNYQNTQQRSS